MSAQIQITSLTGLLPADVFVSDVYGNNLSLLGSLTSIPQTFVLPIIFNFAPAVIVKIIDSNFCEEFQIKECISQFPTPTSVTPTPTPSITPTITLTPSITPTITLTPTVSETPTNTPTNTETTTPSPTFGLTSTPTPSITPTATPGSTTPTPTPSFTPTPSPSVGIAYLFIEPESGSTEIGQYLFDSGISFFGFSNISVPNPAQFEIDMNEYISFSGWTGGTFPQVRTQSVPQISGGVDPFGNAITAFNFTTHEVPVGTVGDSAWYTWIIPTGSTNNGIQQKINYSINGNPNSMTTLIMDSTIYTQTFNYTGTTIPMGVYRVYTTFADLAFYIDNTINTIYFKGDTII